MPIGCCSLVPAIATHLQLTQPRSVLDLGIGMGFYGVVVRQWVDLGVQPGHTRLLGVEGFAAYRNPCWDLYDEVVVAPIEEFLAESFETWDAILLLDVLEHFRHSDGERVLAAIDRQLANGGRLYVGKPAVWTEQGAAYENECERHRSLSTQDRGFEIVTDGEVDRCGNQMLLAV